MELERKFLEVMQMMIVDNWNLPKSHQWIDLLNFIDAFSQDSQLYDNDNALKDCFRFFRKVSQLFNFE